MTAVRSASLTRAQPNHLAATLPQIAATRAGRDPTRSRHRRPAPRSRRFHRRTRAENTTASPKATKQALYDFPKLC